MTKNNTPLNHDEFADGICDLFPDENFLLLMTEDNELRGSYGLYSLRLISNCLYAAAHGSDDEGARKPPDVATRARAARINRRIAQLAKRSESPFVLCVHVGGSNEWGLMHSPEMSKAEAIAKMIELVQSGSGLMLEDDCNWCVPWLSPPEAKKRK